MHRSFLSTFIKLTVPIFGINSAFRIKKEESMKKLLKNQKGQGVMEYVIISSLVGIVCIAAVKGFGEVVQKRVENMKSSIVKNIDLQK
jgi:Flp pilus assembly pilin Flp